MQVLTFSTIGDLANFVSYEVIKAIQSFVPTPQKPFFVLGLPTGSTPLPVYQKLIEACQKGLVSFKNVVTFNMDEYCGLPAHHEQSYHYFMFKNFFDYIDIPRNQIYILNGMAQDYQEECMQYEEKIASFGGIDIQLAGIGENGHLAFNEPNTSFDTPTHLQNLTANTIEVNSRFFYSLDEVPTQALTIGLKTIFDAKQIIIMATGSKKATAIQKSIEEKIDEACPASMAQKHPSVVFACDTDAASLLNR